MSENMNQSMDGRPSGLSADESELERALGSLAPADAGINRDAMMFAAGKAAATRAHVRRWQAACLAMMVVCAGVLVYRPVRIVERQAIVQAPVPGVMQSVRVDTHTVIDVLREFKEGLLRLDTQDADENVARDADYLRLRQAVLKHGLDALPAPQASAPITALQAPRKEHEIKQDDPFSAVPRWQRERMLAGGQL